MIIKQHTERMSAIQRDSESISLAHETNANRSFTVSTGPNNSPRPFTPSDWPTAARDSPVSRPQSRRRFAGFSGVNSPSYYSRSWRPPRWQSCRPITGWRSMKTATREEGRRRRGQQNTTSERDPRIISFDSEESEKLDKLLVIFYFSNVVNWK